MYLLWPLLRLRPIEADPIIEAVAPSSADKSCFFMIILRELVPVTSIRQRLLGPSVIHAAQAKRILPHTFVGPSQYVSGGFTPLSRTVR